MVKKLAVIFGIIIVIVGLLGFVPGNGVVGDGAIFETTAWLNVIYLIIGIVLLIAAQSQTAAATWLKVFGVVYLILFIDGLFQPASLLGFITANSADVWLHLVLGVVLLVSGFANNKSQMVMDKATM